MRKILFFLFYLSCSLNLFSQKSWRGDPVESENIDSITIDEIVVSAVRASKLSPIANSMLEKKDIIKLNLGQDAPYLLGMQPSVVVSSDAGTGIGYTTMWIRGSDSRKINVTINDVPLNDAESHGVFWVDVPDIAASAQSIQIQRGIGSSTIGTGAFGASINIQTDQVAEMPNAEYSISGGSFNTLRNNLSIASGLIKNHWFIQAKGGIVHSDGFRDRASADLKSYFVQTGYKSDNLIIKLIGFGGFEETYQAWYGVPKDTLKKYGRKFNPTGIVDYQSDGKPIYYDKMVDHYNQDHLQLHINSYLGNSLKYSMIGHLTKGKGYYQDYVPSNWYIPLELINQPNIVRGNDTLYYSDFVQRLWLDNRQIGVIGSVQYEKNGFLVIAGGALNRYYPGKHFGEVVWIKEPDLKPDGKFFYINTGDKTDANTFLKVNYKIVNGLNSFVDIQLRNVNYTAVGTNREYTWTADTIQIDFKRTFFNPKIGFNYNLFDNLSIYCFQAITNREPNREDFIKAEPGTKPKPERLFDTEFGSRFKSRKLHFDVNFYYMRYHNQLVLTGVLNSVGEQIRRNVDDSYRTGLEFSLGYRPYKKIMFQGNITLSKNRVLNLPVNDQKINRQLSYSPALISSNILSVNPIENMDIQLTNKYVGKQYLDNTENNERMLDPYWVFDLKTNYEFALGKKIKLTTNFQIINLLNKEYFSNGSVSYGVPLFFPQAGRHYLAGITFKY